MKYRRLIPAVPAVAALFAAPALAQENSDWDWMIEPYAWAASIGTDLRTIRPPTEADSDTSFSDVLDKLDGTFMARVEGRNDRYGAFLDFIYLGLGDEKEHRVLSTTTDLDARLIDAAASFRLSGDRESGLDVFAGTRIVDVDVNARFIPDNPDFQSRQIDVGDTYVDLLLGGRYAWKTSDRWGVTLRADGSLGATDGTWSTSLMASYLTGNGAWLFGYRYLEAEFGNGNADVTLDLSGPLVGYGFRF